MKKYDTACEWLTVRLTVNGRSHILHVAPYRTLLEVLRDELGLTGTKSGCEDGNCGVCTVLLNGKAVKSCCLLIGQVQDIVVG